MPRTMSLALLFLLSIPQTTPVPDPASTLRSTTTLVMVPTLVQQRSGEPVPDLHAGDFSLTDNGIEQKVTLEELDHQPLAVVVLLQTGGAARAMLPAYRNLGPMIDSLMGITTHKVALVTFDSRPEEVWTFPHQGDGLNYVFNKPEPGDDGAALLDAVNYGIDILKDEPDSTRRLLFLFSQPHDIGSKALPEEVMRRLGASNTTLYSVTFSPEKKWLKDQFTQSRHENAPYRLSPDQDPLLHTFDLGTPLFQAWNAMRSDNAGALASLSGGENLRFANKKDLDEKLASLANHIPNRYTLSFRPTSNDPGFHALQVHLTHPSTPVIVSARAGYWSR